MNNYCTYNTEGNRKSLSMRQRLHFKGLNHTEGAANWTRCRHHGRPKQQINPQNVDQCHTGWESQTSMAQGVSGLSPAGWARPARAGPREEERRGGAPVPGGGAEARATDTRPMPSVPFLLQDPHLTGEKTDVLKRRDLISHMAPPTPRPLSS